MSGKPIVALLTNNDDDVYCFRKELLEALSVQGYQLLISCPNGPKFELLKDLEYIYDNPVIDRRGTNVWVDFKLFLHYVNLFKKYRPAVVLTYTAKPNVYASLAAWLWHIPVINNVTGFGSVLNQTKFLKHFIMGLFKCAYRGSACIMFQNKTNMELAQSLGMAKSKCRLIPGSGVNTTRFNLQLYPIGGNGKGGKTVVFNYIGRVLHDKGVDDYIAAAKYIRARYPQTEFNIIGFIEPTENHYQADLSQLTQQGIIRYRGNQQDVLPFIARSHATIHPSVYGEGMSNVLLESASCGRPLITTKNPGCQETVEDGKTGYLYKGGKVDELIQCIERFLALDNEIRRQMGENGRAYVMANFSRQVVIDAYLEEIHCLLRN